MNLPSLDERLKRGDMIQTYKIMNRKEKTPISRFFQLNENKSNRGNDLKIYKKRSRLEVRRNFYSQRVVDGWNKLPNQVVTAPKINAFKARYGEHVLEK